MGTVYYNVIDGEVFSETRDGVRKVYIPDALGNTVALMDSTGALTDTFSYFPSGTVASRTGTTPTPFQWVGNKGYYRDNAKRVHVRERNFYVNLGRWAETDPIGFRGGDTNLYRYVKNRFVVMVDPSGLQGFGHIATPKETCGKYLKQAQKERDNACLRLNSSETKKVGEGKMLCVQKCIADQMLSPTFGLPTLEQLHVLFQSSFGPMKLPYLSSIYWLATTSEKITHCARRWCNEKGCGSWVCELNDPKSKKPSESCDGACAYTAQGFEYNPCTSLTICENKFTEWFGCRGLPGQTVIHEILHICSPPGYPETGTIWTPAHRALDNAAECIAGCK